MRVMVVTGFYPGVRMGGAEYQTALIAAGMVQQGHSAVFVATRAGQEDSYTVDGVQVEEIEGLRATGVGAYRRSIQNLLKRHEPDVCYVRIFPETAEIAALCHELDIPVVSVSCGGAETKPLLFGQHPREALAHLRSGEFQRHWHSFRAIRQTEMHVCNTEEFSQLIRQQYPEHPVRTIYNSTPIPPESEIHNTPGNRIIWVNNVKRFKRPEWFIELANRLPQYDFVMIGNMYSNNYGRKIGRAVDNGPSNLAYLGKLPIDQVNREIAKSDLLTYTSVPGGEGFGNSFLQAWSRGVPTISTFPLDGIPEREEIGRYAPTFDALVTAVDGLMSDSTARMAMGVRAREYVLQNHQIETMVEKYTSLFGEVISDATHNPHRVAAAEAIGVGD